MTTQLQTKTKTSDPFDWLPYAGVGLGTVTGIAGRLISSEFAKNGTVCKASGSGIFSAINSLKQFEIKNFALLTPLIPLVAQIAVDTAQDKSGKGIIARISKAAKKNFTLEQGVYLGAFALFGLTGTSYCHPLGMCSKTGFDASGHMMLKTLAATVLSKGSSAIANKENRTWRHAYNALYAATDAILVHNTVRYCHSVPEVLAGLAWGLGISGAARLATKKIESMQKPVSLTKTSRP